MDIVVFKILPISAFVILAFSVICCFILGFIFGNRM